MKIIFAGTPEFAVPCLEALLTSEHEVIAVYTQPDKPSGRGQKLTASPVKQLASQHHISVSQPKTLRDPSEQEKLRKLAADLMIVVAYGLILPTAILTAPRLGCINVHASLLPRWRGAAPIQYAILAGDTETGITTMQMDEGLDTGDMLLKASCPILNTDTTLTLQNRLAKLGSELLLTTLEQLKSKQLKPVIQDSTQASYAKKIEKNAAEIDWEQSAAQIDRQVRAYNPWPIAHSYLGNTLIRFWQTEVLAEKTNVPPGTIIRASKTGIDVATSDGVIRILLVQIPNSRALPVKDILNSKAELFAPHTLFRKSPS